MSEKEREREPKAYENMLERVTDAMERAGEEARPRLNEALQWARQRAVELGELTAEEAERISEYIRRDVEDAARHLARRNEDLAGWFRMDMTLLQSWLIDKFTSIADRTRLELEELNASLEWATHVHTGEITGPGELRCEACGKVLQFTRAGHVPPCPACSETRFQRVGVGS
ncbi:acyl-homoserine lactone acylase PvdQ [Natronocella acetinitrilica]|uniref:Acyl-homoserine lactone acylase PvdQ n=1 Tax=Natronocella acetinitrilica TaxID=414046 RepID=A0AAE3G2G2_9GAMM|nr:zinc ribbon-containing protein [Natronocella acetinitrilica]MCP1673913.1 acyl-homoserine lactone acylase PvdQ [Natronocella acetinitrilica]